MGPSPDRYDTGSRAAPELKPEMQQLDFVVHSSARKQGAGHWERLTWGRDYSFAIPRMASVAIATTEDSPINRKGPTVWPSLKASNSGA
jgi:hypothetical protein